MRASLPPSYLRGAAAAAAGGNGGNVVLVELGGKEAVVAWSLRRRRGWAEIRRAKKGGEVVGDGLPVKEDLPKRNSRPSPLRRVSSRTRSTSRTNLLSTRSVKTTMRSYGDRNSPSAARSQSQQTLGPPPAPSGAVVACRRPSTSHWKVRSQVRTTATRDRRPYYRWSPMARRRRSIAPCPCAPSRGSGTALRGGCAARCGTSARSSSPSARKGRDDVKSSVLLEFDEDEDFDVPPNAGGG
ncbi:hypothetical protein B0H19DRAFT_580646 [Mycena capillaripes]|nr:hypothetical protein B0H19DRAFT_580646 [Mycena capillaripes]